MGQGMGLVFNIQKFSLHDGPGIRTVVFLKGCPLRCGWCSNPESQSGKIQILWDGAKCFRCGACEAKCERQAIRRTEGRVTVDAGRCNSCLSCVTGCPGRALKSEGEFRTVDEVMDVVMQDVDFYEESGGGVTLSGGEVMLQPSFAKALLGECREKGLHTAVETTCHAETEVFLDVVSRADLLLCDIKHWDSEKHRVGTGVGNELILKNIKAAADAGKEILLRLPVIPGYNDSPADADGFVKRMKESGLHRIQLLPFHQFGENKYSLLGRRYAYEGVPPLHPEDLNSFKQVFIDAGMDAII